MWVGIQDIIGDFRKSLGLKRRAIRNGRKRMGAHALYHSKVPISYIWSKHLVPRPGGWLTRGGGGTFALTRYAGDEGG